MDIANNHIPLLPIVISLLLIIFISLVAYDIFYKYYDVTDRRIDKRVYFDLDEGISITTYCLMEKGRTLAFKEPDWYDSGYSGDHHWAVGVAEHYGIEIPE